MNKLAIVIPYYRINFFEETLQSVARQSNRNFTLYIGNDASQDNPKPIIEKYFSDKDYFYFDYRENLGGKNLAKQWERILESVTEEWFQILGDDDVVSENFVEEFYKNYQNFTSVNFIKFRSTIINENRKVIYSKTENLSSGYYSTVQFFLKKIQNLVNSSLSEHIVRTAAYRQSPFKKYPLAWHSDDYFLLDISQKSPNFYFISEAHVTIKETSVSISGNAQHNKKKQKASEDFFYDVLNFFYNANITPLQRKILVQHVLENYPQLRAKKIYLYAYGIPAALPRLTGFYSMRLLNRYLNWETRIKNFSIYLNYYKYLFELKFNPHIRKQIGDPLTIPIIIINFNQLQYLKQLVKFLLERNFSNITIIDNKSTYEPLLSYYKNLDKRVEVRYMDKNYGHNVFFENENLQKEFSKGYFIITDADIVPNKNLPTDFVQIMLEKLNQYYNKVSKVGFALNIDDIPATYPLKEKVQKWEKQFWSKEIETDIYYAPTDTTFALYKPHYKHTCRKDFLRALRMAGNFTAQHGGWYLDPQNLSDEQRFYLKTSNSSSSWRIDEYGNHLSTEYDKFIS